MVIDSSGRVGIGSTLPNATLFVQGNATVVGNLNVTGTSYLGNMDFTGSTITAAICQGYFLKTLSTKSLSP